jgi:hypothetical protein
MIFEILYYRIKATTGIILKNGSPENEDGPRQAKLIKGIEDSF